MLRMREAPSQASQENGSRTGAIASLHVAVLLFGFAGLFGKWIALPPAAIVFGRTTIAALALGMLLALRRSPRDRFEWRLAANGALLAVHWVAFFQAVQSAQRVGVRGDRRARSFAAGSPIRHRQSHCARRSVGRPLRIHLCAAGV